ncbi:lysosomal-associated transmembrane protein 5 [Ascaphus truei]|uniref:lysosomal-associated transmembrane protein 5 n=1 Tax=Ascaphus truei TaxID=8439 RepID=UPI003F5A1015
MCLSLLSLCSSYVEVPTYLNFRSMNHMNYFPRNDLVTSRKFVTELIFFNLLFIAVLFHKAFLIRCVWRFFRSLENPKKPKVKEATEHHDTFHVVPPSYEEAVKMPANECPPPPYTAV